MEDTVVPAPVETESAAEPKTFDEAVNAALEETQEVSGEEVSTPAETEASEAEKTTEEATTEAEHIAWMKSVEGNVDPESGEVNIDRISKQAFELHKQTQQQASNLSQLNEILKNPQVSQFITELYGGKVAPREPATIPNAEKTDEEILGEFVDKRFEARVGSLNENVNILTDKLIVSEQTLARKQLIEEFPNYDEIKDQVGAMIGSAATRARMSATQLMNTLALNGTLHETLQQAAMTILYPALAKEKSATVVPAKTVVTLVDEAKKRTNLTNPGANSNAQSTEAVIATFEDAADAAEEEIASAK